MLEIPTDQSSTLFRRISSSEGKDNNLRTPYFVILFFFSSLSTVFYPNVATDSACVFVVAINLSFVYLFTNDRNNMQRVSSRESGISQ